MSVLVNGEVCIDEEYAPKRQVYICRKTSESESCFRFGEIFRRPWIVANMFCFEARAAEVLSHPKTWEGEYATLVWKIQGYSVIELESQNTRTRPWRMKTSIFRNRQDIRRSWRNFGKIVSSRGSRPAQDMDSCSAFFELPDGEQENLEDHWHGERTVLYLRDCTLTPKLCKRRDRRV